jgi:SAM-dependent methyltransferase
MLSLDETVRLLRANPPYPGFVEDVYFDQDVSLAAERFSSSHEFAAVLGLLGHQVAGSRVLDLGAGTGIASYAFVQHGAARVHALEPDPSEIVGWGAIAQLRDALPIEIIEAYGEDIPLDDESIDIVYTRQVLHHTWDLPRVLRECARVLRPGGQFLACREHVVDDDQQLETFLKSHPVHQLAGGENAYRLDQYLSAISGAGLQIRQVLEPWDTVINAFPAVRSEAELRQYPHTLLQRKFGFAGAIAGHVPGVVALVWKRIKRPLPGRMYTFYAAKP